MWLLISDVAADMEWVGGVELGFDGRQLLIPTGFLLEFVTRVPDTESIYKSDYYAPGV
jgi:dTDP-4-dehydrorhamnose 3,5-epimerase-like enzyme